jgi:microcystin-dependent protein
MPRNGSGTYSLPQPPFVAGTVISSSAVNSNFSDIATALTGSLPRDGQAGMTGQLKIPDGSSFSPSLTFTSEPTTGFHRPGNGIIGVALSSVELGTFTSSGWNGGVSGNGATPIGAVIDFAGSSAPSFWLTCAGQLISRTTYSALFGVIGTTYGAGDGSTTFNLPDYRGRTGFGQDSGGSNRITVAGGNFDGTVIGNAGGQQNQQLTLAQLPSGITSRNASQAISVTSLTGQVWQGVNNTVIAGGGLTYVGLLGGLISTGNNDITVTSNNTGGLAHPVLSPAIITNKIIYVGV